VETRGRDSHKGDLSDAESEMDSRGTMGDGVLKGGGEGVMAKVTGGASVLNVHGNTRQDIRDIGGVDVIGTGGDDKVENELIQQEAADFVGSLDGSAQNRVNKKIGNVSRQAGRIVRIQQGDDIGMDRVRREGDVKVDDRSERGGHDQYKSEQNGRRTTATGEEAGEEAV